MQPYRHVYLHSHHHHLDLSPVWTSTKSYCSNRPFKVMRTRKMSSQNLDIWLLNFPLVNSDALVSSTSGVVHKSLVKTPGWLWLTWKRSRYLEKFRSAETNICDGFHKNKHVRSSCWGAAAVSSPGTSPLVTRVIQRRRISKSTLKIVPFVWQSWHISHSLL